VVRLASDSVTGDAGIDAVLFDFRGTLSSATKKT
jgi:hypothetical protein